MPPVFMARANGPQVREIRRRREITQEELARMIGSTRQSVSTIEGGGTVSKRMMHRVARALKVKLADITLPQEDEQPEADAEPNGRAA